MRLNNIVLITGRLTADPDLKNTSSGLEVCSFTVAVDRPKPKDGEERQTDFIPCVAWRQRAVFINKYFCKGKAITIGGTLQSRKYEDKDGNKRTAYEVVVDDAAFVGSKKDNDGGGSAPAQPTAPAKGIDVADDDLPF